MPIPENVGPLGLEQAQCCLQEPSEMSEMFYIYAPSNTIVSSHMYPLSTWNAAGMTSEQDFYF